MEHKVALTAPDDGVTDWTGIPVIYIQKNKKKSGTRGSKAACILEEEAAKVMSSGKSIAVADNDTFTKVADQQPPTEDPSGPPKDVGIYSRS